ncbi:hypothetical protein [Corynebacterium glutamicum]|uniref:hypothetical protein n=1 Tax=Corynebacterium glutamicum TaxID=1718 RepID=UPI00117BF97C|nr:hypothetical protein [Corynebacterium glutamicum]QDQ19754.1 hypothetical protein FOL53_02525 [Corynebacterium glutamicum]QDQ23321.1 hypothetical protein FOY32_07155 [Corynebacterium glutamicum]
MSQASYAAIHDMLAVEPDTEKRSRLEQFVFAAVCAWPHYSVLHAAQAAIQLAAPMRIFELQSFAGVKHALTHVDMRSALEWDVLGFHAAENTLPILLSDANDPFAPPTLHLLSHDVVPYQPGPIPSRDSQIAQWRRRRGPFHAQPTYVGFHRTFNEDSARMLGNIAQIGALATWENTLVDAASWAELRHPPVITGDAPPEILTEDNAWYHFRIGKHLGRDAFAEIVLCLGNVFCQHLPQVWQTHLPARDLDSTTVLMEAEAAGAIAIARQGGPSRRGASFFGDALLDDAHPLPESFRFDIVLHAACQIQDLLGGDTPAVTSTAWSSGH